MKEDSLLTTRVVTNLITGNHPFRLCIHGCQKTLAGVILVEISFASGFFIKTSFSIIFHHSHAQSTSKLIPQVPMSTCPHSNRSLFCFTWEINESYLTLVGICGYRSSPGLWFAVWLSFRVSIHYEWLYNYLFFWVLVTSRGWFFSCHIYLSLNLLMSLPLKLGDFPLCKCTTILCPFFRWWEITLFPGLGQQKNLKRQRNTQRLDKYPYPSGKCKPNWVHFEIWQRILFANLRVLHTWSKIPIFKKNNLSYFINRKL